MNKKKGFSFIELIIVIAIIGVLALFTFPSYRDTITRARRSDGQTALLALAYKMEAYFAKHHSYQGASLDPGQTSAEQWYLLRITKQTDSEFTLEASPQKAQASNDTACQTLTFTSTGVKGITFGPLGKPTATAKACW